MVQSQPFAVRSPLLRATALLAPLLPFAVMVLVCEGMSRGLAVTMTIAVAVLQLIAAVALSPVPVSIALVVAVGFGMPLFGSAATGVPDAIPLLNFLYGAGMLLLILAIGIVVRGRRRQRARSWANFLESASAQGLHCFVIHHAKPNGAKTDVNGFDLGSRSPQSRNTSVWGRVPAGVTVALDQGRQARAWVPTSYAADAQRAARYRWQWW